jgi:hypothetical protein
VAQFSLIFSKRVSLKYHSLLLAHTEYLAAAECMANFLSEH